MARNMYCINGLEQFPPDNEDIMVPLWSYSEKTLLPVIGKNFL